MCSQGQSVSATPPTPTTLTDNNNLHNSFTTQNPYTSTSPLLGGLNGGSSMLSPPLTANPFSMQSGMSFEWLTPPKNPSPAAAVDKRSVGSNVQQQQQHHQQQQQQQQSPHQLQQQQLNCITDKNANLSSCRYQQQSAQGQTADFMSMLSNGGLGAETVLGRSHNFADSTTSITQQLSHTSQTNQHHQSSISSNGNQLYNSHFSTPAVAAAAAAAAAAGGPYHLQQGHGLPSPTIYPPTPPPSAPWIHPWYTGDSF